MNKQMQISKKGLSLIKEFEALRVKAYKDQGGVWTIGWGHTGHDVYEGKVITKEQAERLLRLDVQEAENAVRDNIKTNLTQNEFDALVSFAFNVGNHAFATSTLARLINDDKRDKAVSEFHRWVWVTVAGEKVQSNGLKRRRAKEAALFVEDSFPDYGGDRKTKPEHNGRESMAQSKTLRAAALAGGSFVSSIIGVLNDNAQTIVIGALVIGALSVAYMARERIKAWAEGHK